VSVGGLELVRGGTGVVGADARAHESMNGGEVEVRIDLGAGSGCATVIASDLSPAYVAFNAGVTS